MATDNSYRITWSTDNSQCDRYFLLKNAKHITGPIQEVGSWILRHNNELYQAFKKIPASLIIFKDHDRGWQKL